jgi:hypothetical protein
MYVKTFKTDSKIVFICNIIMDLMTNFSIPVCLLILILSLGEIKGKLTISLGEIKGKLTISLGEIKGKLTISLGEIKEKNDDITW